MGKAKESFSRYDTADYLETEDDRTAYLMAVVDEGDPALLEAALDDIARAQASRASRE
jgi:probable addiction module antidote protein